MMPEGLLPGLAVGTLASGVYFAGLALGVRMALGARHPVRLLMLSAALRIATLLAAGWIVVATGGAGAFAGFALGFVALRLLVTSLAARSGSRAGAAR